MSTATYAAGTRAVGPASPRPAAARRIGHRLGRRLALHRRSLAVLAPLLVLAAVWQGVGMTSAPQRIDDEGTYVAQAFAVQDLGSLTHYTYFYDHPPLGWLQIAAYTSVSGAFGRYPSAVLAGREAMLVAQLVSCVLLWVLARRLGLARWSAGAAVALFSLSPLAVQFHRTVYLDNVATPWLLAAFVLALSPQRRLWAYAGSGLCFAVAVLSKETSLLLLPALGWQLWRLGAGTSTRRYGLAVAASLTLAALAFYPAYALVKGELLPGPGHVSLLDGVRFQLLSRQSSGSILQAGTQGRAHVEQWLALDAVLPALALASTALALLVRRLRPLALGLGLLFLVLLRPGYLPVPYVIAMLPLGALLVAGVLDAAVRRAPRQALTRSPLRALTRWPLRTVAVVAAVTATAVAAPAWASQQRGLFVGPLDAPSLQAQRWVEATIDHHARVIVDDAFWVDLVRSGFRREEVVWYFKVDTDPAVTRLAPAGWRDYDYVLSTESVRSNLGAAPEVAAAVASSAVVATFGQGQQRVEVRRVLPRGVAALADRQRVAAAQRLATGSALARNGGVVLPGPARDALAGGRVDPRLAVTLGELAAAGPVRVADLPQDPAEAAAGQPVRSVLVQGDAPALRTALRSVAPPYAPSSATDTPGGLRVTWPLDVAAVIPVA